MISKLAAGPHSVSVKDANGCNTSQPNTISQPPLLTASSTKVDVSCNGSSDGSMTVTFGGGTGPYQVSLDGGAFAVATRRTPLNESREILPHAAVKQAAPGTAQASQPLSQPPLRTGR